MSPIVRMFVINVLCLLKLSEGAYVLLHDDVAIPHNQRDYIEVPDAVIVPELNVHVDFYVRLTRTFGRSKRPAPVILLKGKPIKYNEVITNVGGCYSKATGIFTAPRDGVFSFTWTICTMNGKWQQTELVQNDVIRGSVTADSYGRGDKSTASQTAILRVKTGDKISVRAGKYGNRMLVGDGINTFSGWLIHE